MSYEYICKWVLVDPNGEIPQQLTRLLGMVNKLKIPTFQRGISWGKDEVLTLLSSDSVLFGNVILGMFDGKPGELVDGLQRFAVGTVILQLLYDKVLSSTPSKPDVSDHFLSLRSIVGGLQPVFSNNHNQLLNHPRGAIQNQYGLLFNELRRVIDDLLLPQKVQNFAEQVNTVFLEKQVAIDQYFGFKNSIELVNTFIGLNTVRVELSSVDLIRSYIVERASSCSQPWATADIEQAENEITETFTENTTASVSLKRELLPTATVILKCLQEKDGLRRIDVFPNWDSLRKDEVNKLLDFLDQFVAAQNTYIGEIKESGSLPLAIVILFYYRQFLKTDEKPAFLTSTNTTTNNSELHRFLCAVYRALIEGTVGRLGDIAENVLKTDYATLDAVADDVAKMTGSGCLDNPPQRDWLKANLASADAKKARRVFNACILPERINRGGSFHPNKFGRKSKDWQIDHLIPQKLLTKNQSGYQQGLRLQNLAPLPASYNRMASNTPCSEKLNSRGIYNKCLQKQNTCHPFMEWLVKNQGSYDAELDDQSLLEPNAEPNIGHARIDAVVEFLMPRL